MTGTAAGSASEAGRPTWLGHPRGLFVLFFAEMWERFSYYGMRALLIFYLVQHWMFSDGQASVVYGAYTALVYITPVIGGYLADRWLGQRKAVLYGAVLLTFGHLLMAVEGDGGQAGPAINVFWLALSFIIVGSGFLKANISVIVGQLYSRTDPRRDPAYTIFYMGINLGAALGAIFAGYLGQTYGWAYGFGAAGVGMLLGLIVFVIGKPWLEGRGESPNPQALATKTAGLPLEWWLYLSGIVAVGVSWVLIQNQSVVGMLLGAAGVLLLVYVLHTATFKIPYFGGNSAPKTPMLVFFFGAALLFVGMVWSSFGLSGGQTIMMLFGLLLIIAVMVQQSISQASADRDRIYSAMFLIVGSILFWALFEQAGSSLNLFTDRSVDRNILGWDVPASMFQSINSIYIVTLAPLFAILWLALAKRGLEPSAPAKFGLAMLQLGLGFLVLVWGSQGGGLTPVIFIFLIYLLHTTGELCLSPVGLSAMNRLAPAHMASLIMGTWFFASATGNFAAGLIASATGGHDGAATAESTLAVYSNVGWMAIGAGVLVLAISPLIKRLMHLDTLKDDTIAGEGEIGEPAAAGVHPGKVD